MTANRKPKAADGRSTVYLDKDGVTWRGQTSFGTDPVTGKRIRPSRRGKTKAEVTAKLLVLEKARDRGVQRPATGTVADWLETWIAAKSLSVVSSTVSGYRCDQKHIDRVIGKTKLTKLTPEDVERLYRDVLAKGRKPGTVMHIRRTLSAALNVAVERGSIPGNVVKLAIAPAYAPAAIVPYDLEQGRKLIETALTHRCGIRFVLQLALGLRQGETLGLDWELDLNLTEALIAITKQLQPRKVEHGCSASSPCGKKEARSCPLRRGGGLHRVDVKSEASRRTMSLGPELVELLRAHLAAQIIEREKVGDLWQEGNWVFRDELGRPYNKKRDLAAWYEIVEEAGVPKLGTHGLRHSAATYLLQAGLADSVVARTLGHTDVRIAAKYAHIVNPTRVLVANTMQAALWPPPNETATRDSDDRPR